MTKTSTKKPAMVRNKKTTKKSNPAKSITKISRKTSFFVFAIVFAFIGSALVFISNAATVEPPNQWAKYYNSAGPTPGIFLTPSNGITVSQDGAVIENLEVKGGIKVDANNVTIKNVRVLGTAPTAIFATRGKTGLVMDRIEIIGQYKDGDIVDGYDQGVYAEDGYTLRNSRISSYPDGAKLHKNTLVENNYFFNNSRTFDTLGREKHVDGMQSMGGSNVTIRNNTFIADSRPGGNYDMASNLMIQNEFSQISNYTIENNRFSGGAYSVALNDKVALGMPKHKGVLVRNNTFAGLASKGYAQYGPIRVSGENMDVAVEGNIFADNSGVTSKIPDRSGSRSGSVVTTPTAPAPAPTPTPPETEPPVVPPANPTASLTLKGLTNGQTVAGSVILEAIPADAPNLAGVDFYLDNKLVNSQKTAPICLFDDSGTACAPYDITSVPNGKHIFKAVLRYGSNQTVEKSIEVNVQNTPTTTPQQPGSDAEAPTAPSGISRVLVADWTRARYNLRLFWQASQDNIAVTEYAITRDGSTLGVTDRTSFDDKSLSSGKTYRYEVVAKDAAGNTSGPAVTSVKVNCFLAWCSIQ